VLGKNSDVGRKKTKYFMRNPERIYLRVVCNKALKATQRYPMSGLRMKSKVNLGFRRMSGVFIQPSEFFIFAAAGAVSAVLYAVFWLLRHFFRSGGFFEILSDFTFAALSTAVFLFCLTEMTDGSLRFFYFIAYLLTFSALLFLLNTFKTAIIAFFKATAARVKKSALFVNISIFIKKQKIKAAEREEIKNIRYEKLKKQRLEKIEKRKREKKINAENKEKIKNQRKTELKKIRQEKIEKKENRRDAELNKRRKEDKTELNKRGKKISRKKKIKPN
jgi:hypothetical protein